MVCLLGNNKNTCNQFLLMVLQISRLDIIFHIQSCLPVCFSCSMNLLLNIPFLSSTIFSSGPVPKLVSSRVMRRQDSNVTVSGAFRQDLSNHAKMPHPGQSHNVVIYMRAYVKHDSQLGGCEFDLPNRLFLSPWSHFTRQTYSCTLWAAACVISLATKHFRKKCEKFSARILSIKRIQTWRGVHLCWFLMFVCGACLRRSFTMASSPVWQAICSAVSPKDK